MPLAVNLTFVNVAENVGDPNIKKTGHQDHTDWDVNWHVHLKYLKRKGLLYACLAC